MDGWMGGEVLNSTTVWLYSWEVGSVSAVTSCVGGKIRLHPKTRQRDRFTFIRIGPSDPIILIPQPHHSPSCTVGMRRYALLSHSSIDLV